MRYIEFRDAIQKHLLLHRRGATWQQLRETLTLPYDRPCPAWTRLLEKEIGLVRRKSDGRALLWSLGSIGGKPKRAL